MLGVVLGRPGRSSPRREPTARAVGEWASHPLDPEPFPGLRLKSLGPRGLRRTNMSYCDNYRRRCFGSKRRLLALLTTLLSWLSPGTGQVLAVDPARSLTQYAHDVWRSEDGLPQNSVTAIVQTRDGYLWLGTEEGLVRFDGTRFIVFNKRNSVLRSNSVWALLEGQDGSLWIGTRGGLYRLRSGQFAAYTTWDGLSSDLVLCLYEDQAGSLWIGTQDGLAAG